MTPKEAMNQVRSAMDLKWTSNDDAKQAEGLIAQLIKEIVEPAHLLRLAQTLWVEPGDPAGRKRACMQWLLNRMQDSGLIVLSDSESGPRWAQSVAWSALRIHTEQHAKGAGLFIRSASAAEWVSIDERFKQLIEELISISLRKEMDEAMRLEGIAHKQARGRAPDFNFHDETERKTIEMNFEQAKQNARNRYDSDIFTAFSTLDQVYIARSDKLMGQLRALHTTVEHLDKQLHLATDVSKSAHETNILWWGQALYSPSLLRSYRDMDSSSQLLWMAEDLAYLANQHPSGPTTAFLSETLRRLNPNIDQRHPLRQHISDFIQAAQNNKAPSPLPLLQPYPGEDLTGFPFSFALQQAQTHASTASILDAITQNTGLPLDKEVSTRTFAQWLFRERSLTHWLNKTKSTSHT